jgi:AcrR family transcriptional regulator
VNARRFRASGVAVGFASGLSCQYGRAMNDVVAGEIDSDLVRQSPKFVAEERLIVKAAYRVIGKAPGRASSVQEILDEAGLSTRAFYRHFRSKDELIASMYRTASQRVSEELAATTALAGGPVEAFTAWVDGLLAVAYNPKRAAHGRVLSSVEALSSTGIAAARIEGELANEAILISILQAGKNSGDFPNVDPVEDARAISSVVHRLVGARIAGESGPAWDEAREHTVKLFLRAFR